MILLYLYVMEFGMIDVLSRNDDAFRLSDFILKRSSFCRTDTPLHLMR